MVKISYAQKPYRRAMMEAWGATCVPSPSTDTGGAGDSGEGSGVDGVVGDCDLRGGGDAASREDTKYSLGSVLNHAATRR